MASEKFKDLETARRRGSFNIRMMSLPPALRRRFVGLSRVEKTFYTVVAIAAVLLASSLLYVRTQIYRIQANTNQLSLNMATVQTQITQYDQDITDATSSGKLGQIAAQSGLTQTTTPATQVSK